MGQAGLPPLVVWHCIVGPASVGLGLCIPACLLVSQNALVGWDPAHGDLVVPRAQPGADLDSEALELAFVFTAFDGRNGSEIGMNTGLSYSGVCVSHKLFLFPGGGERAGDIHHHRMPILSVYENRQNRSETLPSLPPLLQPAAMLRRRHSQGRSCLSNGNSYAMRCDAMRCGMHGPAQFSCYARRERASRPGPGASITGPPAFHTARDSGRRV